MHLIRVDAGPRNFCAGAEEDGGRIVRCAPILRWSLGKPARDLVKWARSKGFAVTWENVDG
jgi:hypothetical protein